MDEAELKRHLTQFGQVESVKLVIDKDSGKRKGFGFIEMPVYDQAQTAINALNGKEFYGLKIALSADEEKQTGGSSISGTTGSGQPEYNQPSSGDEAVGNEW